MTQIIYKNARIIDPSRDIDEIGEIAIDGSVIAMPVCSGEALVADVSGLWVVPGLIDAHVHLREPGAEHKEDIKSGLTAAAAGGFTSVLAMPNTTPANDSTEITQYMIKKAQKTGMVRLYPVAAVTLGRMGKKLAPLNQLYQAGAVAFSDDGNAVTDSTIMLEALKTVSDLKVPIAQHAEDPLLNVKGVVHKGAISKKLGVAGWPASAEEEIVKRDIELARKTGGHLHICHISTKGSVDLVRTAKDEGLNITAEVTPHHLTLTDEDVLKIGTNAKVNPPLRPAKHVEACRNALADGTIDIIATDHAPHALKDKPDNLNKAAFGMVGLETAVPLMLKLVAEKIISPMRMIRSMSTTPAEIFGLPGGTLTPGSPADITFIDPRKAHVIDALKFFSKARNTPFNGMKVPGKVVRTIVGGKTVYENP